jgi:hypothetical protein
MPTRPYRTALKKARVGFFAGRDRRLAAKNFIAKYISLLKMNSRMTKY